MTHFLRDILRQPNELQRTIDFLLGAGRPALDAATAAIRGGRHVYLTGIGSSWHAALSAGPACFGRGDGCNPRRSPRLLDWNREQLARGTECRAAVLLWRSPRLYAGRSRVAAVRHGAAGLSNHRDFAQWP